MPQASGPKQSAKENLIFAYDIGDVKNSYAGEPTTNLYGNWNAYTGGSYEVLDNSTNYIKLLASAGTPWAGVFTATVSAGTYTVSFQHKTDDGGSNNFNIDNDTQDDNIWNANITTTTEWQTYTSTKTHTGTGNHLLYFRRNGGAGNIYIRNVQLELKSHATQFIKGTRSATQGLLPLVGNSSIDLSNVSFDSNAQIVFDGTDDLIDITTNFGTLNAYTFEYVVYSNSSANMPISSRTSTAFYKYGAYSWRYTHGGVGGEFYHTYGNDTGWAHWVITYDGSTISVWENGVSKGTSSSSGTADFSGGIRIGSWASSASYTWDGKIPIMKMYNRALTATEVQQNYKSYKTRFKLS